MDYRLRPASEADKAWLDVLRREAYRDLFDATWGGWDETRYLDHFSKTWDAGHISVIVVEGCAVGMIQLLESAGEIEVAEIQVLPTWQGYGLGSRVLQDVIDSAREHGNRVSLYLGLHNRGALRLYKRLGFQEQERSDSQIFMEYQVDGSS